MTNLDYALKYAALGWKVLPCYEINNLGKCSCGKPDCHSPGKHPRIAHGLTDASINGAVIASWWKQWPQANVAVATGAGSGIVVIDIDGEEGERSMVDRYLPPTVEAYTGGGGRHLVYAHPGGIAVKSGAGILPKVDSRAEGGYIIVEPSNHISGNSYEWRSTPWSVDTIAQAPDWWLDLLIDRPKHQAMPQGDVVEGGRNNYLARYAGKLKRMGWTHEDIHTALIVHNQKACKPPLDDVEVTQIARSIAGYPVFSKEEEELIDRGDRIAKALIETMETERQEALRNPKKVVTKHAPPTDFVPPTGIIRQVYDWIIETSRYPLPYLAMAASVSLASALIGRKYATHTNMRPNMYFIGLAESGAGKDHARNCVAQLISASGLQSIMGGSKIASGAGLVAAMEECPTKLYQIDEIGLMLQILFDRNASGHKKELAELMMEMYTTKEYLGTDYAARKVKKQVKIKNPYLCIYGTSTPGEFYKSLSSGSSASGFLNRMVFIEDEKTEKHRDRFPSDPPKHLVDSIKLFYEALHGDAEEYMDGEHCPDVIRIDCHKDIDDSWNELEDSLLTMEIQDEATHPVYTRVPANIMKLATVFSLSRGEFSVNPDDYAMAREIILWSTSIIIQGMMHNVADNETERKAKKLANIVRQAGEITKGELLQKTRWLQKYERDQIVQDLLESGDMEACVIDSKTRPATAYKWTEKHQKKRR